MSRPRIGVLALQGDVSEHSAALRKAGGCPRRVCRPADLDGIDGLVIPGGESTTIGALAQEGGLTRPMRHLVSSGAPVWGTCAGLILLARSAGNDVTPIGGLDVTVHRNAFGRQVDSFEVSLSIRGLGDPPFPAVFIRAPAIGEVGPGVEVLARLDDGTVVAVRQGRLLGTAFHPELTSDLRLHQLFVHWCATGLSDASPAAGSKMSSVRRPKRSARRTARGRLGS